jgi:hypothetical protein
MHDRVFSTRSGKLSSPALLATIEHLGGAGVRAFLIAMASAIVLVSQAAAQAPKENRVFQNLMTATYKCVDIVELEKVPIKDGDTVQFYTDKVQLAGAYIEILGWLEGYFTAMNMYDSRTAGDITMGTKGREWMVWIFNYCKSNPWATLSDAGYELSKVLLNRRNDGSH